MIAKVCFVPFALFLLFAPCSSTKCPGGTIHDKEHDVCLVMAGYGSCSVTPNCVPNTYCRGDDRGGVPVCLCNKGFYGSSDGRCVHGYQETCMTTGDCDNADKELKCGPVGKCICPFPDQYYDNKAKKCVGIYNGNCSAVVACESNFVCKNKVCSCPEGLDLTITQEKCSSGLDKVCSKKEDCDSSRLLLCQQGHCRCQYPLQEYNFGLGMCVGLEGAHCNLSISEDPDNYLDAFCADGTSCQAVTGSSWVGMCKADWSTNTGKILLAIVIFIMFGLIAFLMMIFWDQEMRQFNSHRAPTRVCNGDDLERTTTTLVSCAGETPTATPTSTPPSTPNPLTPTSTTSANLTKENKSLTLNIKGIKLMVGGRQY